MKKLTRLFTLLVTTAVLSGAALAQPGGGGRGAGDRGPGGPGGPGDHGGPGGGVAVASDGTVVYAIHTEATTSTAASTTLKAVSAAGAPLWSFTTSNRVSRPAFAGSLVLVVLSAAPATTSTGTTPTPTPGTIVALQRATGAEAWRTPLTGAAGHLETTADRIYATIIVPDTTVTTPPFGHRSLVALDLTGRILWTLNLES